MLITLPTKTRKWNAYASIVRLSDEIPAPDEVRGYGQFPGEYLDLWRRRDVEVGEGEFLLTGEEQRYGYSLTLTGVEGGLDYGFRADADLKEAMRWWVTRGADRKGDAAKSRAGLPRRGAVTRADMRGAGQYAAFCRLMGAHRRGMSLATLHRSWLAAERLPKYREGVAQARRHRANVARLAKSQAAADEAARVWAEEEAWDAAMAADGAVFDALVL